MASPEYARGWGLGRAAAVRVKESAGCPCTTAAEFNSPPCMEALAKAVAVVMRDGQKHGYLTTPESLDGFRDGFFRQTWELCVKGSSA